MKFACILLAAAPVWACHEIGGERVRGSDLAVAEAAFSAMDPAFDVGPVPLIGIPRVFRAPELERLARRAGVLLPGPPEEVCFERSALALDAATLLPVLEAAFANEHARIEIVDFTRARIPSGKIEFARAGLSATGLWRGKVSDTGGRGTPVWARVKVADRDTGEPIPLAPAISPHAVERGDAVRVEVSSGGVLLAFDGSAETAGHAGDFVLVKNPLSGRRFRARVEAKGKVILQR